MPTTIPVQEEPKRLAPTTATLRLLFGLSGNLCAFPNCKHLLLNEKGDFIAEIAHIEGVKGERFNSKMDNEQRRQPSNLALLCHAHHVETDDEKVWTVAKMREMKETHEARFRNPEQSILAGLKDWTQADELILPKNLDGMLNGIDSPLITEEDREEDREKYVRDVHDHLLKYKNIPRETRVFLGTVVERMETMEQNGLTRYEIHAVSIPAEDFRKAHQIAKAKLVRDCNDLERYGLGGISEGFDEHTVTIRYVGDNPFWNEVYAFCKKTNQEFRTYYLDLNFSGLEG